MRFLLFMGLLASFAGLAGMADCSDADKRFVHEQVSSPTFEETKTNRMYKVKHEQVCVVGNALATDGMRYFLYKIGPSVRYIAVHNGLNGHVQMHGPLRPE
ncbi:hypothetical protein [Pseudoalteromonas sp. McH1-42]|uniref:hypothetical protein n=1 Tax=Pseudoalteromonas sp. McH1-42 TaxID=2917752 RepID=UPI001EF55A94|nr:hypothetical protein [Pseudoalteromonas sp. McH1-42]MCG7561350.1 hypothetical protein [Pseudoalteromonas sp. McH1-42]